MGAKNGIISIKKTADNQSAVYKGQSAFHPDNLTLVCIKNDGDFNRCAGWAPSHVLNPLNYSALAG